MVLTILASLSVAILGGALGAPLITLLVGHAFAPVGDYDEPDRDENAVHDLEHGVLWITYGPSLSSGDVEALRDQLPDNAVMSPYDELSSPVAVTVRGAQLALDRAHDPRLSLFVAKYGDGHTAPEAGVSCDGGTRDPSGEEPEPGVNA